MSQTARIQRHLDRLPPALQNEVLDFVLFLEQRAGTGGHGMPESERVRHLDAALEKLASLGTLLGVDPGQWQRDVRAAPGA